MKAYIESWVANIKFKSILRAWFNNNLLNQDQLEHGNALYKEDFYKPNWYIWIGLFIFTNIAVSFSTTTFLAFLGIFDENKGLSISLFIFSIGLFLVLERFIKVKKLYRSGIDNALLYLALGYFYAAVLLYFEFNFASYFYPLLLCIILLPACVRYAEPLVTIFCVCSFFRIYFFSSIYISIG
jgi:hypothetical protein